MSHVFPRNNKGFYPTAVQGDGVYIIDSEGKRYIDGCCGAAVSCLGHSNKDVRDAIKEQIDKIAFAHTGFFTNEPLEELADFIIDRAPGDLDRAYVVSGGSEAVESAIKLARQYFVEQGETERKYIIARKQSYHGNTIGALSAGGNQWRRMQYEPILVDMKHISPCYEYRFRGEEESSFDYGQRVAGELEEMVEKLGPQNVIGFVAEPVVGATMGCVAPVEGYFSRIREICDKYGILLILDEVMCGMGRTGSLFACKQEGIAPDLMSIAKGLGGGYQPIGAMLASKKIYDVITEGSGFFQHGHTYLGHASACAGALAVQKIIEEQNLLDNVLKQGEFLRSELERTLGQNPFVGDIRGRGLFVAVEFVRDKLTKEPFDPSVKLNAKIKQSALAKGLMCYAMGGTVDGKYGDHVMFAPPFIVDSGHIEEIVDKFCTAVNESLEKISSSSMRDVA